MDPVAAAQSEKPKEGAFTVTDNSRGGFAVLGSDHQSMRCFQPPMIGRSDLRRYSFVVLALATMLSTEPRAVSAAESVMLPTWHRWPESLSGQDGREGEFLWQELRCGACHGLEGEWHARLPTPPGPRLERTPAAVRASYLGKFLEAPATTQPGTVMPDLLHGQSPQAKKRIVTALVHFLASCGPPAQEDLPVVGSRKRGEQLFYSVGCAACHGNQDSQKPTTPGAKPIGHVASKYTLGGLATFLRDPLNIRPAARMPDFGLSEEEATNIAAYLLDLPEVSRIRYAYYEGRWNTLPPLDELGPVEVGGTERIEVEVARRRDFFALRFEGQIRIEQPGIYRFRLRSDDGSRLTLDGRVLIDNDGIHALQESRTQVRLEPGTYPLRIDYFEHAGEESVQCEVEGPGVSRRAVESLFVAPVSDEALRAVASRGPVAVALDPVLAAEGKRLFGVFRCGACHTVSPSDDLPMQRPGDLPTAVNLDPLRGCLADSPPAQAPRFALLDAQRQALRRLIPKFRRPPEPRTPKQEWQWKLATFACYACHERDGIGGVTEPYDAFFETTTPEMGDEGRLPPSLNGVGGKLTLQALNKILTEGAKDRPYMRTRMPRFGDAALGNLVALWAQADALEPLPPVTFPVSLAEAKLAGWAMVGEGGFGCVKCHTFGTFPAQGIQAINLQSMHDRLRPEWFRRYMRNPAAFRPGTRMPSAWPLEGKSLLDYLNADPDLQVAAIWAYLEDGPRARTPTGLITPPMELVPVDRAIVYRNFIAGAGARAIAVGFPEGIHMAFDAEQMRLALLWQGRFLDVTPHWTNRSAGFVSPAGERVWKLAEGPPLAYLDTPEQAWPTQPARSLGYQFLGYDTTPDGRPTLHYRFADVFVSDRLDPAGVGPGRPVSRYLVLRSTAPKSHLFFRAAVGRIAQLDGQPAYRIDNQGLLRVDGIDPIVRHIAGNDELLVPITWKDGQAQIVLLYSWE